MKSRISFFDRTIFRKDITRFAPLWAIYFIGGMLVMMTVMDSGRAVYSARILAETAGPFAVINLIYAALVAQMLFGNLFNSRLCNALHAFPQRRETFFVSHTAAGLCYSLVPHLVAVVFMFIHLQEYWYVGLLWALVMLLEYLFFFGLAVFSALCTGNRFAMFAVYAILNFVSLIAYWFISSIYEPMLFGVIISEEPFMLLCPVVQMVGFNSLLEFNENIHSFHLDTMYAFSGLGEGWGYLVTCAVIGIVLLILALLLYRRRNLETAGDFMAVRAMAPIFAVVYTLCVGCVFALFGDLFGIGSFIFFLIVGMVIGWFTGQMLLNRTVKVFNGRTFAQMGLLAIVIIATLVCTHLDVLGITRWVPKVEDITCVEVDLGRNIAPDSQDYLLLEEPDEIERIISAHKNILDNRNASTIENARTISIRYRTKAGNQVTRTYAVSSKIAAYDLFAALYNTPEAILGYTDWEEFLAGYDEVYLMGYSLTDLCDIYWKKGETGEEDEKLNARQIGLELLEAVRKDCEEGHFGTNFGEYQYHEEYGFELNVKNGTGMRYQYYSVRADAKNTIAWFEKYGCLWDIVY